MARKRAKSMDQRSFGRSFWTVDAARAPGKLCRPPMASPEPGGMLAFAPFQGFIRGMSNKMPAKRVILELGSGNDLHGGDYTKAAMRAVQDALHHSSLTMLRTLGVNSKTGMFVDVTIGVQQPDRVDLEKVRTSLPHGIVTVKAVKGGLDVPDPEGNDIAVIASAAISVRLELP
jgi:uncharacterized protein (TIGR02058 family)